MEYYAQQVQNEKDFLDNIENYSKAMIAQYPWGCNYRPKAYASVCFDDTAYYVVMQAYEQNIRCEMTEQNSAVCTDSCMEFFFQPVIAEQAPYFNFEWNPKGVMHVGLGKDRHDRFHITDETNADFLLEATKREEIEQNGFWRIAFRIPYTFIKKYITDYDVDKHDKIRGNFYKCGDKTSQPHWGCWSAVHTKEPDYHQSAYFGDIYMVK